MALEEPYAAPSIPGVDKRNILENFLLHCGFSGPSDQDQRRFESTFGAMKSSASAMQSAFTDQMKDLPGQIKNLSDSLVDLYIAARQDNTTVDRLQALRRAVAKHGAAAEEFQQSFDSFNKWMRDNPNAHKQQLIDLLGIDPKDFDNPDRTGLFRHVAEALGKIRQTRGALYASLSGDLGMTDRVVLAMTDRGFTEDFNKEISESAGKLQGLAKQAFDFDVSLQGVKNSLTNLKIEIASASFDSLATALRETSAYLESHKEEIRRIIDEVLASFVQSGKDMAAMFGPLVLLIGDTLDVIYRQVMAALGEPVEGGGGIRGLRFALDAFFILLMGTMLKSLVSLCFALGLGPLNLAAMALIGLYYTVKPQGLNEGEDEAYRQAHPGWAPGQPKDAGWKPSGASAAPIAPGNAPAIPRASTSGSGSSRASGAVMPAGSEVPGLKELEAATADIPGYRRRISAENDKFHHHLPYKSAHTQGLAFDQSLVEGAKKSAAAAEYMRAELRKAGLKDEDFYVRDEYANPSGHATGGHIHTQFNSPEAAKRYKEYYDKLHGKTALNLGASRQYASMTGQDLVGAGATKTNNIGSRTQHTTVHITTSDPAAVAADVKQHVARIYSGAMKDMGSLA